MTSLLLFNIRLLFILIIYSKYVRTTKETPDLELILSTPSHLAAEQSGGVHTSTSSQGYTVQSVIKSHNGANEVPSPTSDSEERKESSSKKRKATKNPDQTIKDPEKAKRRKLQQQNASQRYRAKAKSNPISLEEYQKRHRKHSETYRKKIAKDPKKIERQNAKQRIYRERYNNKLSQKFEQDPELEKKQKEKNQEYRNKYKAKKRKRLAGDNTPE